MRLGVKWLAGAGAIAVALFLTSVATEARQLLDVNLVSKGAATRFAGEKVATDRGLGWRSSSTEDSGADFDAITYKVRPGTDIDPAKGTIEVAVQRSRAGGPEYDGGSTYNTLFSIVGPRGERLLVAYILWEFRGDHSISGVFVDSDIPAVRENLWGRMVPFDRKVNVGEWVDLTFAWGVGNARILLDGVEVPAYYRDFDAFLEKQPFSPGAAGFDLSAYLKDAVEIIVGSDIDYGSDNRKSGRTGSFGLYNSVLGKFVVTDGSAAEQTSAIASVESNAARVSGFSDALVAGDSLGVTLQGTAGQPASFDLVHFPDMDRSIALDWRGWGVYLEAKTFFEPGEVDLRDVTGYQVFVSRQPIDVAAPGLEPVVRLEVEQQTYTIEGLEIDTPYYVAVLAEMDDGTFRTVTATPANVPMTESTPGVYTGSHQIGWQDRFARATVVGRLGTGAAAATLAAAEEAFTVDPSLDIAVRTEPSVLKADEISTAKVTVTVTDRNGNPVAGHKVKYLLATTSQYTGVVGGGAFTEQVGGSLKEASWAETDLFGRISATYVAGFAAKTAVIVARDMLSNSTGSGYVKTFIEATAEILLERETSALADTGYAITVSSSDDWLTADGKSQARITAKVTLNGAPVEGRDIRFDVSSGTGSVRAVQGTTDRAGQARAIYKAGTKIGIVMVTATDTVAGVSGGVQIELRSDAPAKIAVTVTPEKLVADGRSTAEIRVLVTDINDNPNENTEIEYKLVSGGGRIQDATGVTDRNGESVNEYSAGRSPGTATIGITVRSTVPTEEELAKARELALAVTDYDFF